MENLRMRKMAVGKRMKATLTCAHSRSESGSETQPHMKVTNCNLLPLQHIKFHNLSYNK
jgi:hypothetical protein